MRTTYKGSKIPTPYFQFAIGSAWFESGTLAGSGFVSLVNLIKENNLILKNEEHDLTIEVVKQYLEDVKQEIFTTLKEVGVCQVSNLHPYVHYLLLYENIIEDARLLRIKKLSLTTGQRYIKKGITKWYEKIGD